MPTIKYTPYTKSVSSVQSTITFLACGESATIFGAVEKKEKIPIATTTRRERIPHFLSHLFAAPVPNIKKHRECTRRRRRNERERVYRQFKWSERDRRYCIRRVGRVYIRVVDSSCLLVDRRRNGASSLSLLLYLRIYNPITFTSELRNRSIVNN